jgi:hypothetical protein
MPNTAAILRRAARLITNEGLHTGEQFAGTYTGLDICAAVYIAAESEFPTEFFNDEATSITTIEASPTAMAAIKALSDALDSPVCETAGQPDYIEHVSNWASTRGPGEENPPTANEVVGRILRTADKADAHPNAA